MISILNEIIIAFRNPYEILYRMYRCFPSVSFLGSLALQIFVEFIFYFYFYCFRTNCFFLAICRFIFFFVFWISLEKFFNNTPSKVCDIWVQHMHATIRFNSSEKVNIYCFAHPRPRHCVTWYISLRVYNITGHNDLYHSVQCSLQFPKEEPRDVWSMVKLMPFCSEISVFYMRWQRIIYINYNTVIFHAL